jgi:uncharacterized membrane protein
VKVYTYSEARQNLASLLEEGRRDGPMQIRRRDGQVAGLSRSQIAKRLGKPEGAVRTMLSRALADLADEVKGTGA